MRRQRKEDKSLTEEQLKKAENLYHAITNISDELIEEAQLIPKNGMDLSSTKHSLVRTERSSKTKSKCVSFLIKTAAACFVFLIVGVTVVAASPSLRRDVLRIVVEQLETNVEVSFHEAPTKRLDMTEGMDMLPNICIGWLPNGGIITLETVFRTVRTVQVDYEDGSNIRIDISGVDEASHATFSLVEEDAEKVQVGNYQATQITYEDRIVVFWYNEKYEIIIIVTTRGVSKEDTLRVSENIILERKDIDNEKNN